MPLRGEEPALFYSEASPAYAAAGFAPPTPNPHAVQEESSSPPNHAVQPQQCCTARRRDVGKEDNAVSDKNGAYGMLKERRHS